MKKNVIFTIGINNFDKLPTMLAMEEYSKKCDVDFFVLKNPMINYKNFYFEKFFFTYLLNKYDRVLYLDADVLITPDAENVFQKYPNEETFYAFNETDNNETMDRDPYVEPLLGDVPYWPLDKNNKKTYFNAGVFLVSKPNKKIFDSFKDIPNIPGILSFGDQTYLNYLVFKNKIPFESLDYSFNRMHLGNKDPKNERYSSNFIHYAGPDVYGDNNKFETINNDYINLYKK
jgi:lipopolysaccharide biosynthesis glycosyltransferase